MMKFMKTMNKKNIATIHRQEVNIISVFECLYVILPVSLMSDIISKPYLGSITEKSPIAHLKMPRI